MGEVAAAEMYTQDGTVDLKGNPALKENTGNWRACPYILGTPYPIVLGVLPSCLNPWRLID